LKANLKQMPTYLSILALAALLTIVVLPPPYGPYPEFGNHDWPVAQYYIDHTLGEIGAWNVMTAIVWDYRGYDTLGESAVLFTAIVGVLMLFRTREKH